MLRIGRISVHENKDRGGRCPRQEDYWGLLKVSFRVFRTLTEAGEV